MKRGPLLLVLLALGCSTGGGSSLEKADVAFQTVEQGNQSGIHQPTEVVIRSEQDWVEFCSRHRPGFKTEVYPPLDFEKEMVVGVFLGTRPSGGHLVSVSHIEWRDGVCIVHSTYMRPKQGSMVTQALTYPYHLVRTERMDGEVRFEP